MKRRLTERWIDSVKPPKSGQVDHYDTAGPAGFHLRVSHGGTKSFGLWYRRNKRSKRWTIGRWGALSLSDARQKAKEIDTGKLDPAGRRAVLKRAGDFTGLVARFLQKSRRRLKPKTWWEWMRIAKKELRPEFGRMAPHEIRRADIRAFVEQRAERHPYQANRILELVRVVFNWGVKTERIESNPCAGLGKPGAERSRERILSTDEIRLVLKALNKESPRTRTAFLVLFLTAARKGEVVRLRRGDIDFASGLATFRNTKSGGDHVIPLSKAALEVIESLEGDRLFPGVATLDRAMPDLRARSGVQFRVHDVRRTVASGLARLEVPHEVISSILNHTIKGPAATRIYQRHSMIPQMRRALERWAQELERIQSRKAAKVVSITT